MKGRSLAFPGIYIQLKGITNKLITLACRQLEESLFTNVRVMCMKYTCIILSSPNLIAIFNILSNILLT
jgi:hypothetical protein